ncbi:hypothetical protein N7478_000984 [Penicillium angulare]|uniref:uncharacterized protein n=1 Tax=Penicillium angulare TaxID=116970 RepID=UPI00253FD785|nr:uncharacterized protein N7478_000984 [Penicillium angulare]KAJ5291733.1 hypothetical protein N7478_000984 [Penicillium angulare]
MPGPRQGNRRADRDNDFTKPKPQKRTPKPSKQPDRKPTAPVQQQDPIPDEDTGPIDLSSQIPLSLQQLLLDVFKTALLTEQSQSIPGVDGPAESGTETETPPLDIKSLIQTIKSHLYQRDFDSAFTDAGEDNLRAYALRWSASRALGYAGLFKGVLGWMRGHGPADADMKPICKLGELSNVRTVCLGGGAGAELVALAAAWRDMDFGIPVDSLAQRAADISLEPQSEETQPKSTSASDRKTVSFVNSKTLSISAVDIADWSSVVDRLSKTIVSSNVPFPSTSRHKPPLIAHKEDLDISFRREDLLEISEDALKNVLLGDDPGSSALLVTLMFTLNELFSTSMSKTTGFLLRLTEILPRGSVLLVVDSPGSYSSLKLKGKVDGEVQEKNYPMKFLLDHTFSSVAKGKWERVFTQDSKWWRREAARLRYEVGEGAGLEDMRFQVHIYQRL